MVKTFSHSKISTFEQCPYKYKLKYLDKIEPVLGPFIESVLGECVHKTLEKLYIDLKFQKLPTKEQLLEFFETEWSRKLTHDIQIIRKEYTKENYKQLGEKFLTDYYDHYHPFNQTKVIGTEEEIRIPLDSEYELIGYIDRLDYNKKEQAYEIHDYKTSATLKEQEELDKDRQLALYAQAVKQKYKDAKKIKLVWHFLAHDKEVDSYRTDLELIGLKQKTLSLIKFIESQKRFEPRVSSLCDWCEYKPICPKWSHLYKTKISPQKTLTEDDGVKLVNSYAQLQTLKQEAEKKLDEIKQKLIDFAKQEKIDSIFGDSHKINIIEYEDICLPPKNQRAELNQILKRLGKWEEVSDIDRFALSKIIKEERWPKELLGEIKAFAKIEKTHRLYLAKIRERK